jgi:hypothetical protein
VGKHDADAATSRLALEESIITIPQECIKPASKNKTDVKHSHLKCLAMLF